MSKLAALLSLGGAVAQAAVLSATGQHHQQGSGQRQKKKRTCTPCEAMARVDAARAKVSSARK